MVNVSNGNNKIQHCQTDYLKSILNVADKNKDGKVSIFELQNFRMTLNLLSRISNNKDVQELLIAAQFAETNFQPLNKATNAGSIKEGIDIKGIDLVSKYDKNSNNISLNDIQDKNANNNDFQSILTKFINTFMSYFIKSLFGLK